ncbi:hypothetical protein CRUP_033877 [Coryphaenoides rupestris]|nr:hypothetical protein CRUP_033877 [Coryphaenoides rupestris]
MLRFISRELDQSMFENSGAQQQVNDLLRRKEQSPLGDIGVTEVNKSVGAVWSCMDQVNQSAINSHASSSFDAFPRLDPPPPTGRKRLPRALKTTQDMMISSDPVVSAPEAADHATSPSSSLAFPDRTPLLGKEEAAEVKEEEGVAGPGQRGERKAEEEGEDREEEERCGQKVNGVTNRGQEDLWEDILESEAWLDAQKHLDTQTQLPLSVPDLIHKDPPGPQGEEVRLASTPSSGKGRHRISLGEDLLLLENGSTGGAPCRAPSAVDEAERHPDLLSFEYHEGARQAMHVAPDLPGVTSLRLVVLGECGVVLGPSLRGSPQNCLKNGIRRQ